MQRALWKPTGRKVASSGSRGVRVVKVDWEQMEACRRIEGRRMAGLAYEDPSLHDARRYHSHREVLGLKARMLKEKQMDLVM